MIASTLLIRHFHCRHFAIFFDFASRHSLAITPFSPITPQIFRLRHCRHYDIFTPIFLSLL
jgi:hypothetical protein